MSTHLELCTTATDL